jgi:hypothetical protein
MSDRYVEPSRPEDVTGFGAHRMICEEGLLATAKQILPASEGNGYSLFVSIHVSVRVGRARHGCA